MCRETTVTLSELQNRYYNVTAAAAAAAAPGPANSTLMSYDMIDKLNVQCSGQGVDDIDNVQNRHALRTF